jgi:hypothetical protein
MKKRQVLASIFCSVIALSTLFLTVSCQESEILTGSGSLEIVIPGYNDGSKSIMPSTDDLTVTYIQISGYLNTDTSKTLTAQNFAVSDPITLSGLSVGTWTISVTGYNGDPSDGGVALTAAAVDADVSIQSGAKTSATFKLVYLTGGTGTAQIEVTWPKENSTIGTVLIGFSSGGSDFGDKQTSTFVTSTTDSDFYSATNTFVGLPVGDYDLLLMLYNNSGTSMTFPMIDTVNIFNGLTSNVGSIDLQAAWLPIAAAPTFVVGDETFDGDETPDSIYRNVTVSTTTPGAYIYYTLDGTDPNGGSSCIISSDIVIVNTPVTIIKAFTACNEYMDSAVVSSGEIAVSGVETGTFDVTEPDLISNIVVSQTDATTTFTVSYDETGSSTATIRWYLDGVVQTDTDDNETIDLSGLAAGDYRLLVKITKGTRVFSGTLLFTIE